MNTTVLDSLIYEFNIISEAESHDAWFRAKVAKSMNDKTPNRSHDEAMAFIDAELKHREDTRAEALLQRECEELRASVEHGRADIAAGRCCSHQQAMERVLQSKAYEAELLADIEQAQADFAAGRVYSSAEVMANAMAAIAKAKRKAGN